MTFSPRDRSGGALELYRNTEPEKALPLIDVVDRVNTLLQSIPGDIKDRYFMELNNIAQQLILYADERYYEVQHKRGVPKIETIGKKIWMTLFSLETKLSNNIPGAGEKLMPWAYENPKGTKKMREWVPGAEAVFRHFMPPISKPYCC